MGTKTTEEKLSQIMLSEGGGEKAENIKNKEGPKFEDKFGWHSYLYL